MKMRNKVDLVLLANDFALQMGLPEPPSLTTRMVGKMGLKGVTGISIKVESDNDTSTSNRQRKGGTPNIGSGMTKKARKSQ